MATLGLTVDSSQAVKAASDLDKLVAASGKAEKGAGGVSKAFRDMQASLASITAVLQSIDRNTASLAAGANKVAPAVAKMDAAVIKARADFVAFDTVTAAVAMELRGLEATAPMVTREFGRIAPATDAATEALRRNTKAANDNRAAQMARASAATGPSNLNTANIAAQFQDIAVTSAMGMSPLQIALQQGTQLSAVLGGQGLTGVVRMLGAAFASVLSPVSLLTIGAVALSSVAIQALGGIFQGAEDASDALEKHNDWLDKILAGYDDVRDAADQALEAALKLPEASAASSLGAQRNEALEAQTKAIERALELRREFEGYVGYAAAFNVPSETIAALEQANSVISRITEDSALSRQELDQFHVALTELGNNTADQNIKAIVAEALALVDAARQATAEVASLDAGLNAIDRDIQIRISMSQEFGTALDGLSSLYQDPRSRFDIMREQAKNFAEQASVSAVSYSQAAGAGEEYARVLESINAAEAAANEKANARASSAANKPMDQWKTANDNFMQRIEQQRMEMDLLGKSTFEIERQRAAFDLLNQAKQAGLQITEPLTQQINQMASEYAGLVVQTEQAAKAQALLDEQLNFYRGTFTGFFGDLKSGLQDGQSLWEALGNAGANALDKIADRALSMAANGLFDMIFGSIFGGFGGNSLGGGWGVPGGFGKPGIFGIPGMATGGTVGRAGLSWVGEQGPELLRLPQGAQVIPNGPSMAMAANQNGRGDVYITISGSGLSEAELSRAIAKGLQDYDAALAPKVEAKFRTMQTDPRAADGGW